jgi:hypothetical protein
LPWHHEIFQVLATIRQDPGGCKWRAITYDVGLNRLSQERIGYTDNSRFGNSGQRIEHVFDFFRSHLLSPAFDNVIFAADEIEEAFLIASEEIATVT